MDKFNNNKTLPHDKKRKLFGCSTGASGIKKVATNNCGKTKQKSKHHSLFSKIIKSTSTLVTTKYLNGDSEAKYEDVTNGIITESGVFKNGKKHGKWNSYYDNGEVLSRIFYDDGIFNGAYIFNHKNGTTWINGYYKNGLKDGDWYERDESQNRIFSGSYEMGNPIGIHKYYNDKGKLILEKHYGADSKLSTITKYHVASGGVTVKNILLDMLS